MGIGAALFFSTDGDKETLHKRIAPSDEQLEYLRTRWSDVADHVKEYVGELAGAAVDSWIQGSYKFGTLLKPASMYDDYDVDLGVHVDATDQECERPGPLELKGWVREALEDYAQRSTETVSITTPPKERCERLSYEKQRFHITAVPQVGSEENHLISLPFWHRVVDGAGEQGGEVAALEQVEVQETQDVLQ